MPGTFVIDRSGSVAYAHVDADYRTRPEPREIVECAGHYGSSGFRIETGDRLIKWRHSTQAIGTSRRLVRSSDMSEVETGSDRHTPE